jgi:nucleotide-binding universal stress UspA family protein
MYATVIVGLHGRASDADALALADLLADAGGAIIQTTVADGGPVGCGLHDAAISHGADLIVVGSSGRGLLGRVLAGDDVKSTLRSAPCAVAIAPHGFAAAPHPIARIGVGYDASRHAQAALDAARAIAERDAATVDALGVTTPPQGLVTAIGVSAIAALEARREHAERAVAALGPGISARATSGIPHQRLAELSERVDLLVVGSSRRGPFSRVVLGSTSEALSRESVCPLLVVPAPASSRREPARLLQQA